MNQNMQNSLHNDACYTCFDEDKENAEKKKVEFLPEIRGYLGDDLLLKIILWE